MSQDSSPWLLVVVPILNEELALPACLAALRDLPVRVVVVDGGSVDSSCELAAAAGVELLRSGAGRARQMNAGANLIEQERAVLFLHADVRLPEGWLAALERALEQGARWGRFDVRLDSRQRLLSLVGAMMNLRSRLTGICTGDQAIFVESLAWRQSGGYASIPLMEDIELSGRLRRQAGAPAALRSRVLVSARRWQHRGVLRTIALMWTLRALYFAGCSPEWLHRLYYRRSA
jgi:rSAM/selenodomain-associated transferase 2